MLSMAFTVSLSVIIIFAGALLMKKLNNDRETISSFECGFESSNRGMLPFSIRFYLLANIFLIFDVELILLFPFISKMIWISGWISTWIFIIFLLILSLGLFHEWNQKMLQWV